MKIVFLIDVYPHPFKPYFDVQFEELVRDGHEVHVFSLAALGGDWTHLIPMGVNYRLFRAARDYPVHAAIGAIRTAIQSPHRTLRLLRIWRQRGLGFKDLVRMVVLHSQQPRGGTDLFFVHNLAAAVQFWYVAEIEPQTPYVMYYHGGELPGVPSISPRAARRAFAATHLVFTNTLAAAQDVISRGCRPDKVRVVPVGFRIDDYQPAGSRPSRAPGTIRLLAVGRVAVEKGLDIALKALAILRKSQSTRHAKLTIVGDGPDLPRIKSLAADWQLTDCVRFTGRLDHSAVLEEMREADALVLTSIGGNTCSETQACVVQEAMLMNLPVVASAIGGVPESMPDELRHFLFTPGDPLQLAKRIHDLFGDCGHDPQALGTIARDFAVVRYDVRHTSARILAEVAGLRRPPVTPA